MKKTIALLGFFVLLTFLFEPFIVSLAMGAVLAIVFNPLLKWVERHKISPHIAAGLLTAVITIVLLLPLCVLIFAGVKAGFTNFQAIRDLLQKQPGETSSLLIFFQSPKNQLWIEKITHLLPFSINEITQAAFDVVKGFGVKLANVFAYLLGALPEMVIAMIIIVLSLYFFLVDGTKIMKFIRINSMFHASHTNHLIKTVHELCQTVVLASIFSGLTQTVVVVVTCAILGISNLALIALLIFMGSFVPLVGSAPITFVLIMNQILLGNAWSGFVLLLILIFISGLDNVVRAFVMKGGAHLHPFLAFLAALGGIKFLGISGIFLGPILVGFGVVLLDVFSAENQSKK